ncbi:alkane 1-monooxygenase [Flammeovirga sp. MY04]|uniref:alkane 1-monooxygenase n=1 Tax=Flammeovirga sp. MY04 TaxID=1191459 RepID=UPI00080637BF|nr:alkane 1-monooxygenase [Flammeovirga sp. MY04]ANQ48049.1 alkane 1-monooxygenase [Flammeovirga sp. MY04]
MNTKELKYFSAYLIPLFCLIGFLKGGFFAWGTVIFAFIFVPILDAILPTTEEVSDSNNKEYALIYDLLLYFNLVWVYGLVALSIAQWEATNFSTSENIGLIISLGLVLGTAGINVAHELGHRNKKREQIFAQLLLLPSFYMHFFIEHNRGHHYHVATPNDPATAKKNEWLYLFWMRSIIFSYVDAWKIQLQLLKGKFFTVENKMLWYSIIYLMYMTTLFLLFNSTTAAFVILSGFVGVLLLETINYVEHYGLLRKKLPNGRYEKVQVYHSWNANYTFGRIILFELTRHSDHHYKASKKYHTLEHQKKAPELPFGYPAAIICALFPPIWFWVMNRRIV